MWFLGICHKSIVFWSLFTNSQFQSGKKLSLFPFSNRQQLPNVLVRIKDFSMRYCQCGLQYRLPMASSKRKISHAFLYFMKISPPWFTCLDGVLNCQRVNPLFKTFCRSVTVFRKTVSKYSVFKNQAYNCTCMRCIHTRVCICTSET